MMLLRFIGLLAAFLLSGLVSAHEFWVQPEGAVAPGGELVAHLRRGQHFRGDPLVYNPSNFERFEIIGPSGTRTVEGRLGDKPALRMKVDEPGLHVVVYVTDVKRTTYTELAQFEKFVESEGFEGAMEAHAKKDTRKLFSEAYTRFAKALVPVGSAAVPDRTMGLPIEIVLEDMPFAGGKVRARVFLFGQPMVNAQVRTFARPLDDDMAEATETTARTDAWGRVTLALPANSRILLSAVHLRDPSAALVKRRKVVWESLWASSVFSTE